MYDAEHLSLWALRRLFDGKASQYESDQAALHLARCRQCWLLAERAMAEQRQCGEIEAKGLLKSVIDLRAIEHGHRLAWLKARASWIEIRSLSTKTRRDKVRLSRALHTSSHLEVLLEAAAVAGSPAESEEISFLALLTAQQLPESKISVKGKNDYCAECCVEIANARRRQAKWNAARDALQKANEYAERGWQGGVPEGKMLCVTGALEDDLGNIEEARKLLRRAAGIFEAAGETLLTSRTLIQMAYILVDLDPAESLRTVEQALFLMPERNPRLLWFAEVIRINCLLTMGSPQEAALRFGDLQALHEQFREPYMQIRGQFTAARILEGLDQPQEAETLFQEVINSDLEHGLVKDFFLDLVYLFGFHLRRENAEAAISVCQRATQELSLLDDEEGSNELARDQMRLVWHNLELAVRKGTAGLGTMAVLRQYIRSHWRTPANAPPSFQTPE